MNKKRVEGEVLELNLERFKTFQCEVVEDHNHKHCPNYHNNKDRKRTGDFYSSEMCEQIKLKGQCSKGEGCPFSHNYVEMLYRPNKYKTKFCKKFPDQVEECEYGIYCSFAHNIQEIAVPLIHTLKKDVDFYMFHFKTVYCPFNQFEHDRSQCEYCHNWQDFRRKPTQDSYQLQECIHWKGDKFLNNYEDGCPHAFHCTACHGWKEVGYHPLYYKTHFCPEFQETNTCSRKAACPFYHSANDKRNLNQLVVQKTFFHVEVNRNFLKNDTLTKQKQISQKNQQDKSIVQQNQNQMQKQISNKLYNSQKEKGISQNFLEMQQIIQESHFHNIQESQIKNFESFYEIHNMLLKQKCEEGKNKNVNKSSYDEMNNNNKNNICDNINNNNMSTTSTTNTSLRLMGKLSSDSTDEEEVGVESQVDNQINCISLSLGDTIFNILTKDQQTQSNSQQNQQIKYYENYYQQQETISINQENFFKDYLDNVY